MYQTRNTIILQAVSQANSFLCVLFLWPPHTHTHFHVTTNYWSMALFTVLQIPSPIFRTDCPRCHFISDDIRSVCSNSLVNIHYIYTGCHINDFSVCTMPKDVRRAVLSSKGRKLFLYFTAVLNSWHLWCLMRLMSFSNRIWVWFRLRLQITIILIII